MLSTITVEQQGRIAEWLEEHPILAVGVGTREKACSIAAINLALTGELTDTIPDCMSEVIGRWIIGVQDCMPANIRNSPEWRALLPLAAGTGRDYETERLDIILDWMWGTVLPSMQPVADTRGFGAAWSAMVQARTHTAARTAQKAAVDVALAARAAGAAGNAADADADADAAAEAAWAAGTAWAAADAVVEAARAEVWKSFDPIGVLQRLIEVGSDD